MLKYKNIEFVVHTEFLKDVIPHPKPALHFIPKEYKELEKFIGNDKQKETVKGSIPFLDSLTAGYIIPFDMDYLIESDAEKKEVTTFRAANKETQEWHDKIQIPTEWKSSMGDKVLKIFNRWIIITPPGYSCLFINPMNRVTSDVEFLSGIVDTDNYPMCVNLPFNIKNWGKEIMLKKGDPMIQIIPFKRESWKMKSHFRHVKEHVIEHAKLMSFFVDKYKKLFWRKKSWR